MSASWIQNLNSDNSRTHKEDVLQQALTATKLGSINAQIFLGFTKACYNPYVTFGIKQVPTTTDIVDAENPWDDMNRLMLDLSQRKLTGHAARDAVQAISMRFDSVEWNTFLAPVLKRDLRAGISEKTINKICKGTVYEIPVFGCQLATSCEDRPEMRGTKRLEPKLDGVRVLLTVFFNDDGTHAVSYSRNGKLFENFAHIEAQIVENAAKIQRALGNRIADGSGIVFDGEVIGNTFQELMRQARRKENIAAGDSVFNIFDIIPLDDFRRGHWNAPLQNRIEQLDRLRSVVEEMPHVELLPHIMVDLDTAAGKDQLERYAADQVSAGFEGIMIKSLEAPYECKRNTFWLKWKPVYDYDLTVVDIEEGTGKNVGRLGALVCEGVDDGKSIRVNVGSGFTDAQRDDYWRNSASVIGQTAVVICDAITQNQNGTYSLRFPRFKTFRTDK